MLNHILGQVEKLETAPRPGKPAHRCISPSVGGLVLEIIIATMRQLEVDWQRRIGKRRFAELRATLKEFTGQS